MTKLPNCLWTCLKRSADPCWRLPPDQTIERRSSPSPLRTLSGKKFSEAFGYFFSNSEFLFVRDYSQLQMSQCRSPFCYGAPSKSSAKVDCTISSSWGGLMRWLHQSSTYFERIPDLCFESGWSLRELPDLAPVSDAACSGRRLHERLMDVSGLFYRAY